MKSRYLIFLVLFTCLFCFTPLITEPASKHFTLDNGLKILLVEKRNSPMAHIVMAINVGSKDETIQSSGIVHVLEHLLLLGGTESYGSDEFMVQMRQNGCLYNAHTDRDLMTFEISLPVEYLIHGLTLTREKIFHLKLKEKELLREKKIILEEIKQTLDDPTRLGIRLALQKLFQQSGYERPILGDPEVIEGATIEQLNNFYKTYFIPNNCALAIVGDINLNSFEKQVKETFSVLKKGQLPDRKIKPPFPLKKIIKEKREMDVPQSRLIIAFLAPDFNHKDRLATNILTQILGHGINPMLNSALQSRRRLIERLSMSYYAQQYAGAIVIHITMEPKNLKVVQRETIKFLKRTRSLNYSKGDYLPNQQMLAFDYLETAKNRAKLIYESFQERGLDVAVSYARAMIMQKESLPEVYRDRLQKLKSAEIRRAATKYLCGKNHVSISIVPQGDK